jgi:hypothetical protein
LPADTSVVILEICLDESLITLKVNYQTLQKYGFIDSNGKSLLNYVQMSPALYLKIFNGHDFQTTLASKSFRTTSPIVFSVLTYSTGIPVYGNTFSLIFSFSSLPTQNPTPRPSALSTTKPTFSPTLIPSAKPTSAPTELTFYPLSKFK